MHFHCSLWQHGRVGIATMRDNLEALFYQLHDLGHTVSYYREAEETGKDQLRIGPDVWNLVIEAFGADSSNTLIQSIKAGAKVILMVSERPGRGGWNDAGNDPKIAERWYWYKRTAPHVQAQWCWVPGSAEVLKRWNLNSIDVDFGYSPSREVVVRKVLAETNYPPDFEPPHAFGFYGGLTDRRKALLRQFRSVLGYEVLTTSTGTRDWEKALEEDYGDVHHRTALMMQCKVILAPSAFDYDARTGKGWGIFSTSRAVTAMHMFRPVVAEPTQPTVWHQIVEMAPDCGLIPFSQTALKVLKDWRVYQARQFAAFKALMSPELTLGRAIQETLVNRREAA